MSIPKLVCKKCFSHIANIGSFTHYGIRQVGVVEVEFIGFLHTVYAVSVLMQAEGYPAFVESVEIKQIQEGK